MDLEQFEHVLQKLKASREDIRPSEVVAFEEPLRSVLNAAIRLGRISLSDLAKQLELERGQARQIAEVLVVRHLFQISALSTPQETVYETRLSALTRPLIRPRTDIWKKLDE